MNNDTLILLSSTLAWCVEWKINRQKTDRKNKKNCEIETFKYLLLVMNVWLHLLGNINSWVQNFDRITSQNSQYQLVSAKHWQNYESK